MPLYEFSCGQCGKESELLVRSANWQGATCPHCGSSKLAKKLSVFASSVADSAPGRSAKPAKKTGGHGCGGHCRCH